MNTARLAVPTDIYLTLDALNGAVSGIQAFHVHLQAEGEVSEDHYVINAQYYQLNQDLRQATAAYLWQTVGECVVSFILNDLAGRAEVVSTPPGPGSFRPAAAVAVVKAACGWDESNPMIIKVNDSEMTIHINHDGGGWVAISR